MLSVPLELVDVGESREVQRVVDAQGNTLDLFPIEGSERAWLVLRLPSGAELRAEVKHSEFQQHVVPLLPVTPP